MGGLQGASLIFSAVAASCAETATYPLDFLKTRLQLNTSPAPQGLLSTAVSVVRHEGVQGLYAGLSPAVFRHVPYTGVRVAFFEALKEWNMGKPPGEAIQLPSLMLFGFTSGALGQFVAVPADVIKIRMQADGKLVASGLRERKRYSGIADACRKIIGQEGIRGLWRGSLPAVQRAALVNLGELSTYSYAKTTVVNSGVTGGDNMGAHLLAALCSGFVSSFMSTPADVVKTRMMEQEGGSLGPPAYRGAVHCLVKSWQYEGIRGLYKGFLPTWARLGPWQITFWVTFEQIRQLSGHGAF